MPGFCHVLTNGYNFGIASSKMGSINFWVHYEIDDNTSAHVLTLETYGGTSTGSWVLLEELE